MVFFRKEPKKAAVHFKNKPRALEFFKKEFPGEIEKMLEQK